MAEKENPSPAEDVAKEESTGFRFLDLAALFFNQGAISLGAAPHPMTGETLVSFESAQESISILEMLREKTQRNLSEEESRALDAMIDELKLAFVQAIRDPRAKELAEKTRQAGKEGEPSRILTPDGRPASAAGGGPSIILP